jgi:hypothetical protein
MMGSLWLPVLEHPSSTKLPKGILIKFWYWGSTLNFLGKFNFGLYQSNIIPILHEAHIRLCQFLKNGSLYEGVYTIESMCLRASKVCCFFLVLL